jgi:sterol desaturase/sphingolipid hydroxylase (fatty acid hydroxylase superfamily)
MASLFQTFLNSFSDQYWLDAQCALPAPRARNSFEFLNGTAGEFLGNLLSGTSTTGVDPVVAAHNLVCSAPSSDAARVAYASALSDPSSPLSHPAGPLWGPLVASYSDFTIFLGFYFGVLIVYFITAAFFAVLTHASCSSGWASRWRLQPARSLPTANDYWRCIQNIFVNYMLVAFPMAMGSFPIMKAAGLSATTPLPGTFELLWQMGFFLVAEDALHFAAHWALHSPLLYTRIHKKHHEFSRPFGLTASYSTAAEMLILGIPTFAPALWLRPQFFTFYSWFIVRQLDAVLRHSGFDFPDILDILPYYGGTAFHDFHHQKFIFNYGSRFTYLDKLFGTYREPNQSRANADLLGDHHQAAGGKGEKKKQK